MMIEQCGEGDPFQQFYFNNETFYPTAIVRFVALILLA